MILRRLPAVATAMVLALASLLAIGFTGKADAAGATLYWCEYASNASWSTASDWNTASNCSGSQGAPVSGDSLVFNNSPLTSSLDLTNNIGGLDIASIAFEGSGGGTYDITGDAISLDSGITDSGTSGLNDNIDVAITLTAPQTFNITGSDHLQILNNLILGSNGLTLTPGVTPIDGTIAGSGGLTFDGPGSGSSTYNLANADASLTGPVQIDSGALVNDNSGTFNALGTGTITIESGGSLILKSSSTTGTLPNDLNLAGDGTSNYGAIVSCLADSSTCTTSDSVLTLSGDVSLSSDSEVVNGDYSGSSTPASSAEFDFTGGLTYNHFTLTGYPSSNTIVDLPPLPPSSSSSSSSSSKSTVGAPDTGYGQVSSRPDFFLVSTLLTISCLTLGLICLKKMI